MEPHCEFSSSYVLLIPRDSEEIARYLPSQWYLTCIDIDSYVSICSFFFFNITFKGKTNSYYQVQLDYMSKEIAI